MASKGAVGALTDLQRSDKYQRALSLNFDCGSDALRTTIKTILDDKNTTFKRYIADSNIQSKIEQLKKKKFLYSDQMQLINSANPDLECMDVTLLTTLLLELFPTTNNQKTTLKGLKKKRNELAHKPRTMLDDDIPFIEASKLILALSKDISNDFENEISKRIEELKKRELVRTRSNREVIILNGEALIVKLVESGRIEHVDENNEEWIKLGLTKYVRQIARTLDVDVLLLDLKKQGVINDTLRRTIELTYNYEEQMQHLVLHMLDETRENLLKFIACLRKKNSVLADLVQQKPSDEKEIDEILKQEEQMKIKQILLDAFVEEEKGRVACEDIHIFIEDKRKVTTTFQCVLESVKECFPKISFEENDSWFYGIATKHETSLFSEDAVVKESAEEVLTEMSSDKFGVYLAERMEATKEGIGYLFEEICIEECLSAKIFGQLTGEQLEQLFSPKLRTVGTKYGIGIKGTLEEVQKNIKRQLNRECSEENDTLRKFDTPSERVTYTKSTVKAATGNLLTPAHEFIYPVLKKHCNTVFMAKEVIRFALACMNGKKNGTIHFGVKEACNGTGEIVGLPREQITDVKKLNAEIISCIQTCFEGKYQLIAERCIRPAQVITVEEDMVVVEIDIVPFSSHVTEELIIIKFPPKGNQRRKCFAYNENMVITIEQSKVESIKHDFQKLYEERLHLEKDTVMPENDATSRAAQKLKKLLTGGNKFVTDAFEPVICSGNITGCPNEDIIREHMSAMSIAFTSSITVFDFDSSVELRDSIEKENNFFQVKLPEDFNTKRLRRESDLAGDNKIWLYSNGNEELGRGKLNTEKWYSNRLDGVQAVLNLTRQQIPAGRGLVIYFVYQKAIDEDPMLEIARETFLKSFKDECIVIAENDAFLHEWRREMKGRLPKQDFENKIVTGLSWDTIASIVKSVFRPSKDVLYKFPDSRGNIVEMTSKEHDALLLNTLDLVNGFAEEQCRIQEEECSEEKCRQRRSEQQEMFYKGNEVTWWNFYCAHVGKRDKYDLHKKGIRDKLDSVGSADRYETYQIEHQPGAGGSTLARHILWHFSQIKHTPGKAYRCCIVNRITDETAEEIYKFKVFKDNLDTKPVIALVDNKSEEHLSMLKAKIDETAYKKGSPGKLFCLLLVVTRIPVSHRTREIVLGHDLTKKEKLWFEEKFKELEMRRDFNVNTLIAFNVMRHSFDVKFIDETIQQLINDITAQELNLLEILSLICSFDSDNPVPETVFDSLMLGVISDPNVLQLQQCINKPFGIVWSEKERRAMQKVLRETWNVNLTGAMQLFITHRRINSDSHFQNGVCILSQPFSKAIMNHIMASECKSFEDMVDNLLVLLSQHCQETNAMSKHFTRIVCSLFTYRVPSTDRGDFKATKFSALVMHLERQLENESTEQAQSRVVRMMRKCFDISGNAMVGQQLARYHIHLKDYETAEDVIKRCLSILPQNSYLLDTYGQIFKSKMEHIIACKNGLKMNDTETAEFIELAFKAVEKFKDAQIASTSNEDNTSFNSNCFYMEIISALYLLENFHRCECFGDKETFWSFLNDTYFKVQDSAYEKILKLSPVFDNFRNGRETQDHIDKSLRTLEEKAYMTRNHLTTVITPSKDMLLLKPRERFERFYGSKEHTMQFEFLYGVGLKLLMKAYQGKESNQKLRKRMNEADRRLQCNDHTELERDLLIFIGYYIIEISNKIIQINHENYRKLLNYSTLLWQIQLKKSKRERHYVEAYLYYALLHWLLPCRSEAEFDGLSHPDTYKTLLKKWEAVFMENNCITSKDQLFKEKPKIFFALGHGDPGNDIVDLEPLRHKWRDDMLGAKRKRREVKADNHWQHDIFKESLLRLYGTVDRSGRWVSTEVSYNKRSFSFQIHTSENCSLLSNRLVTFVLGFSWMAPVALDVRRAEKAFNRQTSQDSPENEDESVSFLPKDLAASSDDNLALKEKQENGRLPGLPQRIKKQSQGKGYQIKSESVETNKTEAAGGKSESGDRKNQELQRKTKTNRQCDDIKKHDHHSAGKEKQPVTTQHGRKVTPHSDGMVGKVTVKDPTFQASSADSPGSMEWKAKNDEERYEVRLKKKAQPETAHEGPLPLQQAPSSLTPKEKFEALISRCHDVYSSASREKIISAYEKVKRNHKGNIKHLGTKKIVKEVGQNLKYN